MIDDERTVKTLQDTIASLTRLIDSPHTVAERRTRAQATRDELQDILNRIERDGRRVLVGGESLRGRR